MRAFLGFSVGCVLQLSACAPGVRAPAVADAAHSPVEAELEQVTPDENQALALVSFRNTSPRALRVLRFRLTWEGGAIVARPARLTVPAGATLEAALTIPPEAGDLDALYAQPLGSRVVVLAVASPDAD